MAPPDPPVPELIAAAPPRAPAPCAKAIPQDAIMVIVAMLLIATNLSNFFMFGFFPVTKSIVRPMAKNKGGQVFLIRNII
jgi:hypothetical protein